MTDKRFSETERVTKETQIKASLTLDCIGNGTLVGSSGIGFFDHMLNSFCVHGGFSLKLEMTGDLNVDGHHSVEDVGIVMGKLFADILKDKSKIKRFGSSYVPMDEALGFAAVDISGRPFIVCDTAVKAPAIGGYDTQLTAEFFRALAFNAGITLHLKAIYGDNDHHKTEALFKAAARAISEAVTQTDAGILSAKGVL
jgi:imidazoleglycerol-phosphate dehydratase